MQGRVETKAGKGRASGFKSKLTLAALAPLISLRAQKPAPPRQQAPIERRAPSVQPSQRPAQDQEFQRPAQGAVGQGRLNGMHLSEWMDSHRQLPLQQQQRALEAEPGFSQLQPQVQQRMHQRLEQLNTMPPAQRQRVIDRAEAMERLSPPQRQQIRGALSQLGSLPEDQRRAVARNFRMLQQIPEGQREAYRNSPQFRAQFNDQQRMALDGLMNVAPILPTGVGPNRSAQPQTQQPPH